MKDRSASVLVTVSVCKSKTLIGAAISPRCTSAACQMEMEGIWYSAEWMGDQFNAHGEVREDVHAQETAVYTSSITSCTIISHM